MPPIRAVLFDADGVIQNAGSDVAARVERLLGFLPDPFDTFAREVIEAERPALAGQAELLDRLEPIARKWAGAAVSAAALAEAWWCSIEAYPAVHALIARLRRQGIVCALATNQQSLRAQYMRDTFAYDTLFDRSFYSCELGYAKPDPRYFQHIAASLRLDPAHLLFIDDLGANVAAARSVGLQAAQFVHPRTPEGALALRALLASFSVVLPD